ncbi:MAG: RHS repeat-associated core domain-containing protein, partial [Planctomycetota bacterium]
MFDNLKIGTSADNDLDDAGDTIFVDESFGSTDTTVTYDKAGNLIDDGQLQYVYDAWNRLVKVRSSKQSNATIQTAEFDGVGRRIEKIVSNTGTFDATWRYFYDGQKIIETRNGSGDMVQQFIHGTRYIDELVMMRVKDKGDLYVHQDANWNVIALTDLGGSVVERYVYKPYGEVTVHQDTGYGDRDGDGDVDSTDKGTVGSTCTGTVTGACRILDLDFDGDYDSTDATKFDALTQGSLRTPGLKSTALDQPFAHQGLLFEPETGGYYNRARQYAPSNRRFQQRDPIGVRDGLNSYSRTKGNPVLLTDSSGHTVDIVETQSSIVVSFALVFWGQAFPVNTRLAEDLHAWNDLGYRGVGIRNLDEPGGWCKQFRLDWTSRSGEARYISDLQLPSGWDCNSMNSPSGASVLDNPCLGAALIRAGIPDSPSAVSIWIRTEETCPPGTICHYTGVAASDPNRIWVHRNLVDAVT